jgi:hypothetical protein
VLKITECACTKTPMPANSFPVYETHAEIWLCTVVDKCLHVKSLLKRFYLYTNVHVVQKTASLIFPATWTPKFTPSGKRSSYVLISLSIGVNTNCQNSGSELESMSHWAIRMLSGYEKGLIWMGLWNQGYGYAKHVPAYGGCSLILCPKLAASSSPKACGWSDIRLPWTRRLGMNMICLVTCLSTAAINTLILRVSERSLLSSDPVVPWTSWSRSYT